MQHTSFKKIVFFLRPLQNRREQTQIMNALHEKLNGCFQRRADWCPTLKFGINAMQYTDGRKMGQHADAKRV